MLECVNSAIVTVDLVADLGADYVTPVLNFRDSAGGYLQVVWQGVTGFNGIWVVHGGLTPSPSDMDDSDIGNSDFKIIKATGDHGWEYTLLRWKYGQLRWSANGNTTGTARIYAMGKKV